MNINVTQTALFLLLAVVFPYPFSSLNMTTKKNANNDQAICKPLTYTFQKADKHRCLKARKTLQTSHITSVKLSAAYPVDKSYACNKGNNTQYQLRGNCIHNYKDYNPNKFKQNHLMRKVENQKTDLHVKSAGRF